MVKCPVVSLAAVFWAGERCVTAQKTAARETKCPGVIGWKANAQPPTWKVWENAPLLPGRGGGGEGTAGID